MGFQKNLSDLEETIKKGNFKKFKAIINEHMEDFGYPPKSNIKLFEQELLEYKKRISLLAGYTTTIGTENQITILIHEAKEILNRMKSLLKNIEKYEFK